MNEYNHIKQRHGRWELPHLIAEYSNGILHGEYKRFYKTGTLRCSGFYNYEERHGLWVFYNEDGSLSSETEYDNGIKHGVHKNYSRYDKALTVTNYVQGKKHGEETAYYPNGNILSTCTYGSDKVYSDFKKYYENSSLRFEYKYNNCGLKSSIHYFKNGKIKSETFYFNTSKTRILFEPKKANKLTISNKTKTIEAWDKWFHESTDDLGKYDYELQRNSLEFTNVYNSFIRAKNFILNYK